MNEMPEFIPMLIDHSILGVFVCLLGWWIKKQNAEAKCERETMQARLFEIIEKTNTFDANTGHQLQELRVELQRLTDKIEGKIR
jgi:hypothetical protein